MKQSSEAKNINTDVVVIGAGGCGMAAATAAAEKGANVVVLEKLATNGGNSRFAFGIFAAESPVQRRLEIDVPRDTAFKIAMEWSHWRTDPRIVRAVIDKSGDTIKWFQEKGINFDDVMVMYKYFTLRTYHRIEGQSFGRILNETLRKRCEELGVRMFFNCKPKKILANENGGITGVVAEMEGKELRVRARSVIIATGGHGGNKELLKKQHPSYSDELTHSGIPSNKGDGIKLAMEIGAATEEPGVILLSTHVYKSAHSMDAPFLVSRAPQTVWINKQGERFCSDWLADHSNAVYRQPGKVLYSVFDEKIKNMFMTEKAWRSGAGMSGELPDLDEAIRRGDARGDIKIARTWHEMADWMEVSPEVLEATIAEYNSYCDQSYDPIFNKERRYLDALRTPPYYAITAHQDYHTAIGTIKINHLMEVVNKQYKAIPGLYAGGDTCAGWTDTSYPIVLSGFAMSFAVNSGRIAGENAAKYVTGK